MIRIVIVHEQRLLADLAAAALRLESEMEVVGCVCTVEEALAVVHHTSCDVILANITLPDDGVVTLTQAVLKRALTLKILLIGLIESNAYIMHYFEAGVTGYVLAEDSWVVLVQKIRAAMRGECWLSPALTTTLLARLCKLQQMVNELSRLQAMHPATLSTNLTAREGEVLALIEQGYSNLEISAGLCIEAGTVKNHVHNLLDKLGVATRRQAASLAWQALITSVAAYSIQ